MKARSLTSRLCPRLVAIAATGVLLSGCDLPIGLGPEDTSSDDPRVEAFDALYPNMATQDEEAKAIAIDAVCQSLITGEVDARIPDEPTTQEEQALFNLAFVLLNTDLPSLDALCAVPPAS
jgi:hypothetical protein